MKGLSQLLSSLFFVYYFEMDINLELGREID